jgi:hypothetical protein
VGKDVEQSTETATVGEVRLDRRGLLRKAVATAPVIATLHSGAALARTSNVITATSIGSQNLSTLCLDANSGLGPVSASAIDLGEPPSGYVSAITDRDHRLEANSGSLAVTEAQMCNAGGTYYYKTSGGWNSVQVPRGIVVSATALSSFAGRLTIKEI